mmetsp:Transcript_1475/g.1670  ORF Transcript_1475/g.1670 Transcript_1475/m.1670 type:complete len:87 (-) Transcript_1475:50-310(-)
MNTVPSPVKQLTLAKLRRGGAMTTLVPSERTLNSSVLKATNSQSIATKSPLLGRLLNGSDTNDFGPLFRANDGELKTSEVMEHRAA